MIDNKTIEIDKINNNSKKYQSSDKISILASICFFLSLIEAFIPKPLPFLRLGIANLPLILGLVILSSKEYFALGILKILGQALISGSFLSYIFIFSLVGTLASMLGMYFLYKLLFKKSLVSFIGISCFGSILSCISQSFIGYYWILGEGMKFVFPIFFIFSAITGFLLGLFSNTFSQNSTFLQIIKNSEPTSHSKKTIKLYEKISLPKKEIKKKKLFEKTQDFRKSPINLLLSSILFISALLYIQNLLIKTCLFLLFFIFNTTIIFLEKDNSKKRIKHQLFQTLFTMGSIIFINLFTPFGKILFQWSFLTISQGALFLGLKRSIEFEGILHISRYFFPKMTKKTQNLFFNNKTGFLSLLEKSFYYFNILSKQTKKIKPKTFIQDLDSILCFCFFYD